MALELSEQQIAVLERLVAAGFVPVAWPLYASFIGVRKGNCGALLSPAAAGMSVYGNEFCLVEGNPSVRIVREGKAYFVFKKAQMEATPARELELAEFTRELRAILGNPTT
jgi:hypothetical protein